MDCCSTNHKKHEKKVEKKIENKSFNNQNHKKEKYINYLPEELKSNLYDIIEEKSMTDSELQSMKDTVLSYQNHGF